MSDALRKEFMSETAISLTDGDEMVLLEAFEKYSNWLESQLLSEREKVASLTAENERMKKVLSNIRNGCAFPDTPVEKAICIAIDSIYLDGKIVAAVNDNIDTLLEEAPAVSPPTVCRWTWNDDPYPGGWRTSCKNAHGNIDGKGKTPVGVCPYCGLPIKEVKE